MKNILSENFVSTPGCPQGHADLSVDYLSRIDEYELFILNIQITFRGRQ